MKSIISVVLAITVLFLTLCFAPYSFAADDELNFALTTDLHLERGKEALEVKYPENELYFHASGSGNLYNEAEGILKSFLKSAAEESADFVLFAGDMTRSGTQEEHEFVASILRDFEKETGINVYVIPGNHDYYNSNSSDFKKYYGDICYNDALTVDSKTSSYTAELANGYRLIAVDSNEEGEDGDGITDELYSWIETQVAQAKKDGKKIIYTMHHTLLEHLPLGKVLMKDFIIANSDKYAQKFCDMGINYTFTGHEHGNDVSKFVSKNGDVLYDILTTSLTSYPLEYRLVTCKKDKVSLKMKSIDQCDFSTLIDGYNEKQLELMKSDYNAYALGYFKFAVEKKIYKYVSPEFIKKKLKINDGTLSNEVDVLMGLVSNALYMPIYDNGDGSDSIEALAAKKGITLPQTQYSSLFDLVTSLVAAHYYGDENMPSSSSPECELFVKGLNTGLEYILANAGRDSIKMLLNISEDAFPDIHLKRWFEAVGTESSYDVAEAVLYPLLDKFTVDTAPADRDVDLPLISQKVDSLTKMKEIFDSIINFFKYFFNIFISIIK